MNVQQAMTKLPVCCGIDAMASEAAQIFWEQDCGVVPLIDEQQKLCGIVTDRDLCMAAHFRDQKLSEIRLRDVAKQNVHTCLPNQNILEAERLMRDAQVRRVVVVDPEARVIGILSLNDIAMGRMRRMGISDEDVATTLGAICARHQQAAE